MKNSQEKIYWKDLTDEKVIENKFDFTTECGKLIYWTGEEKYQAQNELRNRALKNNIKLKKIIMETKEQVLQNCTVEGNVIKLPNVKLKKELYDQVKKTIVGIGGKWKGGKVFGFVFPYDPTELLEQIANGEKRNLKKENQCFFTPRELALKIVKEAYLEKHHKICEPSAGTGAIVKVAFEILPLIKQIDCCEMVQVNRMQLENIDGVLIIADDFLTISPEYDKYYDRIIANPPFTKNQDIEHIYQMYKCLKSNGRLVTIASKHWQISNNEKETKFRDWIERVAERVEEIPAGTFKESGTNIETVMIIINK